MTSLKDKKYYNDLMNWNNKPLNIEILNIMFVPTLYSVDNFKTVVTISSKLEPKLVKEILIRNGFPELDCYLNWNYLSAYGYLIKWKDPIMANNVNYKIYNDKLKTERVEREEREKQSYCSIN
jgi:hypothetical protein